MPKRPTRRIVLPFTSVEQVRKVQPKIEMHDDSEVTHVVLTIQHEDGTPATSDEIAAGYMNMNMTGYCVMWKPLNITPNTCGLRPPPLYFGQVTDIDESNVYITDRDAKVAVPKRRFHELYEVD